MTFYDLHKISSSPRREESKGSHGRDYAVDYVDITCSCGWKASTYNDSFDKQFKEEVLAHKIDVLMSMKVPEGIYY